MIAKNSKSVTIDSSDSIRTSQSAMERADDVHDLDTVNFNIKKPNDYLTNQEFHNSSRRQ